MSQKASPKVFGCFGFQPSGFGFDISGGVVDIPGCVISIFPGVLLRILHFMFRVSGILNAVADDAWRLGLMT